MPPTETPNHGSTSVARPGFAQREFARQEPVNRPAGPALDDAKRKATRRKWLLVALAVLMILCAGVPLGIYYVDRVPTPDELTLPESTTIYFADGRTPMARLGTENRTIVPHDNLDESVTQAIVAAEDRSFWTHGGVDFRGVLRAAWNNVTGGEQQGASTITQQYARIAADLKGVTYSRKLREAVMAWKLDRKYSKEELLGFYLNTVPFGRGAYGIEAAAQAYFGKSARKDAPAAGRLTVAEAMVLAAMVKQPEANPDDPEGQPGYDPTRSAKARENSVARWTYIRDGMVKLGYLSPQDAANLAYPDTVRPFDGRAQQSGLEKPTGLVVNHVLSELRRAEPFKDKPADYLRNGGFRIVTTIDPRVQEAAEKAADIRRDTAPAAVRGQPENWQAALVAVEPGTGRILAYYGGSNGSGADYAGWYTDENGGAHGYGQHPPGSSFKVYDLAEALRQKVSVKDRFDSPATKEFPASGRTRNSPAGPIRNSSTAGCQPDCTLWEATVASLNVTFFGLTEQLGVPNVIEMARKAGVNSMWANTSGQPQPKRIDLSAGTPGEAAGNFSTEVGIGQYGITVQDHANGMATFAAGGKRAEAHFVRSVHKGDEQLFAERLVQDEVGLDQEQINQLNWTLRRVEAAKLSNGWDSAGKTGTWQAGQSTTQNLHTWMVGYTRALAAAVWLGTVDGKPLQTKDGGYDVSGASRAAPIWQQFMVEATAALRLDPDKFRFQAPKFPDEQAASPGPSDPPASVTARPTPPPTQPTCAPPACAAPTPTSRPNPTSSRTPRPTPSASGGTPTARR